MNKKLIKTLGIIAIIIIPILIVVEGFISTSNREAHLRNSFTQKISERTAFYDKMWKIISQKGQIAVKNDSSFQRNIQVIMDGRKDAPNVFMKWVQETNPNANFDQVSALYADLSRAIESERNNFFNQEKMLQDIKREHDDLLSVFPSSVYASMLGRKNLEYKPITSDRTDDVMRTGKDNDTKVF